MHHLLSKYLVWSPVLLLRGQNIWPLLRHYQKTQYREPEELERLQFDAFRKVLTFAYDNIPFYRQKYAAAGINPGDVRNLHDVKMLPILTKEEVSRGSLSNRCYRGLRFRRSTSGSTGMPLVYYKDSASMKHIDAVLYRNYSWCGIDVGFRQARFWGSSLNRTERMKTEALDYLLNRVRISPFELEETRYLQFLERIKRFRAQYIYGYAQSIYQFCNYFHTKGADLSFLKLKAAIVTSEMIFPSQLRIIEKVLGCTVTQEYGCTEVGLIGFGCPAGNMHLMENLLVESVSLGGQCRDAIVVSELYGDLFPFIRYQIGDRGVISDRRCSCGRGLKILENLTGRKDDFIRCPAGKLVDAYVVEYIVSDMPRRLGTIHQFKMVQSQLSSLRLLIVADGGEEGIRVHLAEKLRQIVGEAMQIEVEFVPSIPRENSGKLKFFHCELPAVREDGVYHEV